MKFCCVWSSPDRPDPPVLLQVTNAKHRAVTLSWTPGDDHNSPILGLVQSPHVPTDIAHFLINTTILYLFVEYVVEFEDQNMKEKSWEELKRVEANKKHANLPLWPYMSYRFRVIAINDLGKSDPSNPSEIYETSADGEIQCFFIYISLQVILSNSVKNIILSDFNPQLLTVTPKMWGVSPSTQTLWSLPGR